MKIRTRLTLQYTVVTAVIMLLCMLSVYMYSERSRSETFFRELEKEGVTKAELFLSGSVDTLTMQSIYQNNRHYIDEVEVAVYDTSFNMLYHDSSKNDIVKEDSAMISRVVRQKFISFYVGEYQAVGILHSHAGREYVVTAAAYDGYGYDNLFALRHILLALSVLGLSLLVVAGYVLAKAALSPVRSIADEAEKITAGNIDRRLPVASGSDELGELAMTFNRLLQRLDAAFSSQKMFVSNVSHELKTPMAALMAELELALSRHRTPEQYEQAIRNVLGDAGKMTKLVDGLLDMARADCSPDRIKMEEVRADELLMDARDSVLKGDRGYSVDIIFESEADDDSVLTLTGNSHLLATAFVNLMENNCKYSSDSSSVVSISHYRGMCVLRFSDKGPGIPEEERDKIFIPFYRGSSAGKVKGHGIGLALARKIVQLHGGTIEVFSKTGEGTTFVVRLPHVR